MSVYVDHFKAEVANPLSRNVLAGMRDYTRRQLDSLQADLDRWEAIVADAPTPDHIHEARRANERVRNTREALIIIDAEVGRRAESDRARAARAAQQAALDATRATGYVVKSPSTGTTHFVNFWGESFCGINVDRALGVRGGGHRATCTNCRTAADAALRDGTQSAGGSPARRQ